MDRSIENHFIYQLNAIATKLLVDPDFKEAFLDGKRRERLQEFNLPLTLVEAINSIESDDVHKFISQLHTLTTSTGSENFHNLSQF